MLLLHMGVERRVAKIRLVTVLALVVATVDVILRSALRLGVGSTLIIRFILLVL